MNGVTHRIVHPVGIFVDVDGGIAEQGSVVETITGQADLKIMDRATGLLVSENIPVSAADWPRPRCDCAAVLYQDRHDHNVPLQVRSYALDFAQIGHPPARARRRRLHCVCSSVQVKIMNKMSVKQGEKFNSPQSKAEVGLLPLLLK